MHQNTKQKIKLFKEQRNVYFALVQTWGQNRNQQSLFTEFQL